MHETKPTAQPDIVGAPSTDYARFIILSAARTGSNMLASALHSHPQIICFRELFNKQTPFIDFHVEGYDRFSVEDRELRTRDYKQFLRERIFCQHPGDIRAVGFKMPYPHFIGHRGLAQWLAEDDELRVVHLQRRNLLRMLVSLKIASATRGWVERKRPGLTRKLTPANAMRAARHPLRAAVRLRRLVRPKKAAWKSLRRPVTISPEELYNFMIQIELTASRFDDLFEGHPKLTVYYEDLLDRPEEAYRQLQSFLGVDQRRLVARTARQNPEPLRKLIANYDELYEAYKDTPHAVLFA